MPNWKSLAAARHLDIPESDLDKIIPTLDGLEAAFRPLTAGIAHETEPAVLFRCEPEDFA